MGENTIIDDAGRVRYDPKSKEYTKYDNKNGKETFKVKDYLEALNLFQSERAAMGGDVSKNLLDHKIDTLRYKEVRQEATKMEMHGDKITVSFKDGKKNELQLVAPKGYKTFYSKALPNELAIQIDGVAGVFRISKLGTTDELIFEVPDSTRQNLNQPLNQISKFVGEITASSLNFWKKYSAKIEGGKLIIERI